MKANDAGAARESDPRPRDGWGVPAALGLVAGLAVLVTLGHPGITIDEPLDVRPGRTYVQTLLARGLDFFEREAVRAVFADNAEHPPLGRWLLGVASTLGEPFEGLLGGPDPYSVHAGRLAPMVCFAILVGLVAAKAGRRYGRAAGVGAGLALLFMPRVFAHAHLAALDTFVALTWTAALLAADRALGSKKVTLAMALAGVVWGLAILTKIHGWLLPPLVALRVVMQLGPRRSVVPLVVWTASGVAVFFLGWPWLWYDTGRRLAAYFGTGVDRVTLRVLFLGEVYADRDVPWEYPWLYFFGTIPPGLLAFGAVGLRGTWAGRKSDRLVPLAVVGILLLLLIFSTNVAVYDGERLFLPAFALWAILVGRGFGALWDRWPKRWVRAFLALFLVVQAYGVVALHPFGLSYYNAAIGGLPGAERLGLELTYWSDAIDKPLLDELARVASPGDRVAIVPTLHHIQPAATMTPALLEKRIILLDQGAAATADWIVASRRTAYWPPEVARHLADSEPLALRTRQGVWLAGLWRGPGGAGRGRGPGGRNAPSRNDIERSGAVVYNP